MPKMKTKSGAKKRLKVLGNGGIKRSMAFKRHILTKKTTKNKRQLRGTTMVHSSDVRGVNKMLPYA
jgi:large subunit ribosomal protein L35